MGVGLAVGAAVVGTRELGWLESWELGAYDNFLRARSTTEAPDRVSLVWIGEEDFAEFDHPIPDWVIAEALETVLELGPRAVGVDVYRDRPVGVGWEMLGALFAAHPELVVVEKHADTQHPGVPPPAFLDGREQVGFADIAPDPDGVTRRGLMMLWDEDGQAYLSLSLQLALRYLRSDGVAMSADPEVPEFVRFGATTLPPFMADLGGYKDADDGGYQYLLDYARPNGSFPSISLRQLLTGEFDPELVRDRVVLLGTASPSVKDFFQTPSGFATRALSMVYGAENHAQAVDQLIRYGLGEARPFGAWSEGQEAAWILLWGLAGALVATRVRSPLSLVGAVLLGLGLQLGLGYAAFDRSLWIPVVPPILASLGSMAVIVAYVTQQERADKAKAMDLFGRYVSRRLVDRIWEQRELFMEGGRPRPQRIVVSVLLSDLSGYTSTAEKAEPADVMDWLGTYTDRMARLVEAHGGMVNDFLGDGLMASFGVPVPSTDDEGVAQDASNAVECALAMGEELQVLNAEWAAAGQPTARMRIGILTGPAVVGHIGSTGRLKYAAVGNTVNTAARLETFDKMSFEAEPEQSTCRVLIGQATYDAVRDRFATRCLGDHMLKGKGEPTTIYRVQGRSLDPMGEEPA